MFKKILVPLDRSALAEQALASAAAIARASRAELDVALVHLPTSAAADPDRQVDDAIWAAEHVYLETIAGEVQSGSGVSCTHGVMRGAPADLICARARDVGADLIVMTSHGRTGVSRAWLGSVTDGVVRHSATPVLILRPVEAKRPRLAAPRPFKRVLVPFDGSSLATEALGPAIDLAQATGATLVLLRVVLPAPLFTGTDPASAIAYAPVVVDTVATAAVVADAKRMLEDAATRVSEKNLIETTAEVVVNSHIADGIVDFARGNEIDVVVMCTHGRGASRLFVGSVADKVLRGSGLPVMLLRPTGEKSARPLLTLTELAAELPALSIA